MKLQKILDSLRFVCSELDRNAASVPGDPFLTRLDMIWCGLRYGAAPSNYVNFQFYRIGPRERSTFLTHRTSQKLMRLYNTSGDLELMRNKFRFSQTFAPFFGRDCISSRDCTEEFMVLHRGERLIYKPLRGGQGRGIRVFDVSAPVTQASELQQLPEGVVETWITQHPEMARLYPDAINPIRIQTIHRNGKTDFLCATITAGRDARFANASSRALFALVDVRTGVVCSDACDYDGGSYPVHPQTGITFRGFAVPNWDQLLQTVAAAAAMVPSIGYIGWDVAITDSGAVLIEGNNDPGYTAYQLPNLTGRHTGTLELYKPYLK